MISIITPTYNRELLVQRTINSIQEQTYSDWQLIIVDDGSTDNTEAAIQPYLEDARISYHKKNNTGQSDSLNVGVSHAEGDFIVFLDSDDEAYPHWLQTVTSQISNEVGLLSCEAIRKFEDGKLVREELTIFPFLGKKYRLKFTCGSFFIRRSLFLDVGGYDVELKSNIQTDLGYRLLLRISDSSYTTVAIDEPLMQINIHAGPRIRTDLNKVADGGVQFLKKHQDFFEKHDRKVLSFFSGSIAYCYYRMKKRKEAIAYCLKAIRYNPLRWGNYLRVIRYACL